MSHSRRRHSAESFLKSWFEDSEYLLLIVVPPGIEPDFPGWQPDDLTDSRWDQIVDRMRIEPTTETLQVFLAKALEHASP